MEVPDIDAIREAIRSRQQERREPPPVQEEEDISNEAISIDDINDAPDPNEVLNWLLSAQYKVTRTLVEENPRSAAKEKELLLRVATASLRNMNVPDPVDSFDVGSITINDLQQLREALGIGVPSGDKE